MKDAFGVERSDISKAGNAAKWLRRTQGVPKGGFTGKTLEQRKMLGGRAAQAQAGMGTPGTASGTFDNATRASVGQSLKRTRLDDLRRNPSRATVSPKDQEAIYGRTFTNPDRPRLP